VERGTSWHAYERGCQRCWLRTIGFYFHVIQEGEIGAGERIVKLSDGPKRMTVAEIDALLYSAEHPLEALRRAVRIPALSPGWQRSMQGLLAAAEAGGTTGNAGLGPARRHLLRGVASARL
jgi:MOSC domain-containing protein YiiM